MPFVRVCLCLEQQPGGAATLGGGQGLVADQRDVLHSDGVAGGTDE